MTYTDLLSTSSDRFDSIVCLGLDPVLDKIPLSETDVRVKITRFFKEILSEIKNQNIYPSAVKPNYAFYAQYGFDGLYALKDVIDMYKAESIPVILDSKRGDIGTTSAAYAKESFEFFGADAVTLAPYMGYDSISPFIDKYPDKGYYILCRTSNKSAIDFQNLETGKSPLYIEVAKKICEWNASGLGAVTGATYPGELQKIEDVFSSYNKNIPLLIPGVGSQGGDVAAIIGILKKTSDIRMHRINSSSGIIFAHEKHKNLSFAEAAVTELKLLNSQISSLVKG